MPYRLISLDRGSTFSTKDRSLSRIICLCLAVRTTPSRHVTMTSIKRCFIGSLISDSERVIARDDAARHEPDRSVQGPSSYILMIAVQPVLQSHRRHIVRRCSKKKSKKRNLRRHVPFLFRKSFNTNGTELLLQHVILIAISGYCAGEGGVLRCCCLLSLCLFVV